MHRESARQRVESVLLSHPAVGDCAVLERRTDAGESELVAYVVPMGAGTAEELSTFLQSASVATLAPGQFVSVSSIPLAPDGHVDAVRLQSLPLVDDVLVNRWQACLNTSSDVERAAVIVQESPTRAWPLHLSDLLTDWREVRSERAAGHAPPATLDVGRAPASGAWAISEGGPLLTEPSAPARLGEALCRAAAADPRQGIVYIEPDGTERQQPYATLLQQAERTLTGLRAMGLKPGDRVILQLERHQQFIEAFWACVLGGFVPVPLAVTSSYDRPGAALEILRSAWPTLGASTLVTERRTRGDLTAAAARLQLDGARVVAIQDLRGEPDTRHHCAQEDEVALLMLTSGSTGAPKAVMLTHRNLLARSIASRQLNRFSSTDVTLNWMPLDHVAGLIYFHIRDVCLGCPQIHIPTSIVLQDPLKWLDYLERYKATITFAPNFAFGLVNARETDLAKRTWDLSSVRFVLNGAEVIVARTARTFLRLLAPHGLAPTCMHPAWGMSETSSGVTYSNAFSLAHTSDEDAFVEVGRPIAGFAMRIVDSHDRLILEGVVGRLQVRGATVTSGYFNNPDLTRESFSADGWFNTGDLGTIRDGRLTITGREKDVVIVNSVNYHCHAIEAAVEELADVEGSYTAACAVRRHGADTDSLALFFHPRCVDGNALAELLERIRSAISARLGIVPQYLVPVDATAIPKTSLGKIQRVELARRLLAGDFDDTLKHVDRLQANANTIPDWFYRKVWRRRTGISDHSALDSTPGALIFGDPEGLGHELRGLLEARGGRCVMVGEAESFARAGAREYRINPRLEADYARLVTALAEAGDAPTHIVQLWGYGRYQGEVTRREIDDGQIPGALSAAWLTKALAEIGGDSRQVRMTFVGSHTQRVHPNEPVAYEKAAVLGLIKSIPQEVPSMQCRHIDVYDSDTRAAARLIVNDVCVLPPDREVAYRDGLRFVARLEKVAFRADARRRPPFTAGGMYLISGGAGGIGERVSQYLVERYGASLLLIGRSGVEGRPASVLAALARLGGQVAYESADVCDESRVADVVARYEALWGRPLRGIVHLAGLYHECPAIEETADRFREALRAKTVGTDVLHRVLEARGGGLFVSSSSVAGFFGGANIAAYSAANAFQEAFAEHHRDRGRVEHYCFSWSNWEAVGQSRAYQMKDLPRARGYQSMAAERAVQSLLVGLTFGERALLVGLDAGHRHIRRYLANDADTLKKIVVYYTTPRGLPNTPALDALEIRDRWGVTSRPDIVRLQEMPLTRSLEVDEDGLARLSGGPSRRTRGAAPRTDLERLLAGIWARVLAVPDVSIDDNFFDLGGDSLLAVRLIGRVREDCAVELSVREVFDAATLADLAATIARRGTAPAAAVFAGITTSDGAGIDPQGLLERLDELTDDEVEVLLKQLAGGRVAEI